LRDDLLIRVAHALALVGLGRTDVADLGRGLADLLPVVPLIRISVWLGVSIVMPSGIG
jgi:hypothetical protein